MRGQSEGDGIPVEAKRSKHPAVGKRHGRTQESHLNTWKSGIETQLIIVTLVKWSQFQSLSHRSHTVCSLESTNSGFYCWVHLHTEQCVSTKGWKKISSSDGSSSCICCIVKAIILGDSINHRNVPKIQYIVSSGALVGWANFRSTCCLLDSCYSYHHRGKVSK